ncbi:MAG TPA: bifunctional tetrahydrofolate synthase/dihydrofolate synthase [Casimicrobiaceae bacterium]
MAGPGLSSALPEWLAYLETLHPKPIAMGLERVAEVAARMGVKVDCPVITVAGTNGKGSTCAMLESIYRRAGYRTGLYTSPHLVRFNERVRIAGAEVDDATLIAAFAEVEAARSREPGSVSLTYFEFSTLAALRVFAAARLDVLVLEVGLGGRLDAVNIVDADVAVITTVDIDHVEYLGNTREAIAREKAGIMRAGRITICGDPDPPRTLVEHAREIGAPLWRIGHEYRYRVEGLQWRYEGPGGARYGLPHPALRGRYQLANAATVLAAQDALHARLPVQGGALRDGLVGVELAGRFQVLPGRPAAVLDVAHNPHAARALAATLDAMGRFPRTFAVFGMLADKDIDGVIAALAPRVDVWHVAPLPGPRGAKAEELAERLVAAGVAKDAVRIFADVAQAWRAAAVAAGEADRIAAFGSFLTIAAVLAIIRERTGLAA